MSYYLQAALIFFALIAVNIVYGGSAHAKGVYQTEEAFLHDVFGDNVPQKQSILLRSDVRESVEKILNHPYAGLKIVYWEQNNQSAWILEEIGKEHPITFGIVVANGKIKTAKVLEFREIRGWEIKYPAFTRQFIGASLRGYDLDRSIDGVSGATLSVWAMTAVAKLALYLDGYIKNS